MITYLTPYYENAGMLREQLRQLASMGSRILKRLEYIVVDDGSPNNSASEAIKIGETPALLPGLGYIDFQLYRIDLDIRWNHIAARNIAVNHAKYEWLFMTDMDHRVPEETWEYFFANLDRLEKTKVYKFLRVDAPDMNPYKPHPHTWLMHRTVWDKFGGYDERFSGHYGMDFLARERLQAFTEFVELPVPVVRYPREVIPDASTTNYARKTHEDRRAVKEIRRRLKAEGTYEQPKTLTFPYHKVYP